MHIDVTTKTKVELDFRHIYDLKKVIDLVKQIDHLFYENNQTADELWSNYSFSIDIVWMEEIINTYNKHIDILKVK